MARRNRDLVQILDEHERAIRRLKQSLARAGGVIDHGALTGLGDNDHTQYALLTGAVFTGNVSFDAASTDPTISLDGTIAGGYWAGSIEFVNTDGGSYWRVGQRGDSDSGDGGNFYMEYYTGSAFQEWLMFDHAEALARFGKSVEIYGTASDFGLVIYNTSGWGSIELGGSSGGFLDFKNSFGDDYDIRFILIGDDTLRVDGGDILFSGRTKHADGLQGAPSITFGGDTNTGIFWPGTDQIGFSAAGIRRFTINNTYLFGVSTTGAAYLRSPVGTAAAPAFGFYGDWDTGIYWGGTDVVGLSAGAEVMFTGAEKTSAVNEVRIPPAYASTGTDAYLGVTSSGYLRRRTSSRRYKSDIVYDGVAERLLEMRLKPVHYYRADHGGDSENSDGGREFFGLIAEDVADLHPSLGMYDNATQLVENFHDDGVFAIIIAQLNDARDRLIAQDARIERLEAALHRLKN